MEFRSEFFFKWYLENNLLEDHFLADFQEEIARLKNGTILLPEFVKEVLDGKLVDDDFKSRGKGFAKDYYSEESDFHKQYASFFMDFENIDLDLVAERKYTLLAPILTDRFKQWEQWLKSQ
jgi:hypothetical protein